MRPGPFLTSIPFTKTRHACSILGLLMLLPEACTLPARRRAPPMKLASHQPSITVNVVVDGRAYLRSLPFSTICVQLV